MAKEGRSFGMETSLLDYTLMGSLKDKDSTGGRQKAASLREVL